MGPAVDRRKVDGCEGKKRGGFTPWPVMVGEDNQKNVGEFDLQVWLCRDLMGVK